MKCYHVALLALVAFNADNGTAFTPNSLQKRSIVGKANNIWNVKNTQSYATSLEASTAEEISFPYDESVIKFAYDEWRVVFNKGAVDPVRYENYKTNYKTLTDANLTAKQNAEKQGTPAPNWMSLNEFGDYSMAEYEAAMRGEPHPAPVAPPPAVYQPEAQLTPAPAPAAYAPPAPAPEPAPEPAAHAPPAPAPEPVVDGAPEPVVNGQKDAATQDLEKALDFQDSGVTGGGALDAKIVEIESLVRASYQECRNIYIEWCRTYGKQEEALRFATFSSNYIAMRQFTEQAGTELRLNQYADCTKDEYFSLVYGPPEAETVKKEPADVLANQRAEDARRAEQIATQKRAAEQMDAQRRAAEQMAVQQRAAEQRAFVEERAAEQRAVEERAATQRAEAQQAAPPATDSITYSNGGDGVQGGEYQDQYGRTVRPAASGPVDPNVPPSTGRPTLVIPKTEQQTPARPTEVIKKADQPRRTVLIDDEKVKDDVPVMPALSDPGAGGVPVRGTEVIRKADVTAPQGTQVIRKADEAEPPMGTQVIRKGSGEAAPMGTQVIKKGSGEAAPMGTQVIKKGSDEVVPMGTQVIKKGPGQTARETLVVRKGNTKKESPFKFPFFQSEEDDDQTTVAPRGTIVIKKQIPEPAQNTFGLDSLFGSPNKSKSTVVVQETPQVTSSREPEWDAMASVFSFFGGEKKRSNNPPPVRGTILIPKGPKRAASRSTVLIKKSDEGGVVPSIFSFFGGAKKKSQEAQDDEKRPSITVGKKADWTSPFSFLGGSREKSVESVESLEYSAETDMRKARLARQKTKALEAKQKRLAMETERAAKTLEAELKRAKASRERAERLEAMKDKSSPAASSSKTETKDKSSPAASSSKTETKPAQSGLFSFFTPKAREIPEVSRWKQNWDGSITGFIYNSKSFKDGTRVTTSPVPGSAKPGTTVTTGSGSQYSLQLKK